MLMPRQISEHELLRCDVRCVFAFDDQLSADWDELLVGSHANTVFLTSGWLRAWAETLGNEMPMLLAQVRLDDRLVAAAAFQVSDGVVEFAAKGPSDYADFLISKSCDSASHAMLIDRLLEAAERATPAFRHFKLSRIRPDSTTMQALTQGGSRFIATILGHDEAPYMDMRFFEDRVAKKSLRRHERGLQRLGLLDVQTLRREADILPRLEEFFEQHVHRSQFAGRPSLFDRGQSREFYRAVVRRLDSSGELRFTVVTLNGKCIASHFGFAHAGAFIWYKPAFDPTLAKLSPGEVLIKKLFETAHAEGSTEFDFTVGAEPFKFRFASGVRRVHYVHLCDSRVAALARRSRIATMTAIRRVMKTPKIRR